METAEGGSVEENVSCPLKKERKLVVIVSSEFGQFSDVSNDLISSLM